MFARRASREDPRPQRNAIECSNRKRRKKRRRDGNGGSGEREIQLSGQLAARESGRMVPVPRVPVTDPDVRLCVACAGL